MNKIKKIEKPNESPQSLISPIDIVFFKPNASLLIEVYNHDL